jgi:hypothetical protein
MIKVKKHNREIYINEDVKDRYLKLGYSVIDAIGKVIEEPTGNKSTVQYEWALAEKDAEIIKLRQELSKFNKRKAGDDIDGTVPLIDKPQKTRKPK